MARRNRIRDRATSWELPWCAVRAEEAPNPGEETGGMSGLSSAAERLAATVKYHQSHASQRSRRADPPAPVEWAPVPRSMGSRAPFSGLSCPLAWAREPSQRDTRADSTRHGSRLDEDGKGSVCAMA